MDVFIGCSSQGIQDAEVLMGLIQKAGMTPVLWSSPNTSVLNAGIWEMLLAKTREVYAAVFLFREDDKVKRGSRYVTVTRDNVILEFGLFSGALGPRRCAIVMKGKPGIPVDLKGIIYASLDDLQAAEQKIYAWAKDMRNDIATKERDRRNLKNKQIAAIARAMQRTGIEAPRVRQLMGKLGVSEVDVAHALGKSKAADS